MWYKKINKNWQNYNIFIRQFLNRRNVYIRNLLYRWAVNQKLRWCQKIRIWNAGGRDKVIAAKFYEKYVTAVYLLKNKIKKIPILRWRYNMNTGVDVPWRRSGCRIVRLASVRFPSWRLSRLLTNAERVSDYNSAGCVRDFIFAPSFVFGSGWFLGGSVSFGLLPTGRVVRRRMNPPDGRVTPARRRALGRFPLPPGQQIAPRTPIFTAGTNA